MVRIAKTRALVWKRVLVEKARATPAATWSISTGLSLLAHLVKDPLKKLKLIDKAIRAHPTPARAARLRSQIDGALASIDFESIDWPSLDGEKMRTDLPKGIILKPPVSPREKGVIYLTFENQWIRLIRTGLAERIAQDYDLVLGPSFSPPPEVALLLMLRFWPGKIYTLLSNRADGEIFKAISPRLLPIPLLSSSWVDPAPFVPWLGSEKQYDIVMLANFALFKRHWHFFDVLRKLPQTTRALLLGVPLDGRTEEDLRAEARLFGVEDQCSIVVRPSRDEIMSGLASAKISLIFSIREGGCIAVAESLFANTPVGLLNHARIGSSAFINDQTGRMLSPRRLPEQLLQFLENANSYRPRAWAESNISCHRSTEILNAHLRSHAEEQGRDWTLDLYPIVKGLVPEYLDPSTRDEMLPWYQAFKNKTGLQLGSGSSTRICTTV